MAVTEVVIVGGGIAGLSAAGRLTELGIKVHVYLFVLCAFCVHTIGILVMPVINYHNFLRRNQ